MGFEINGMDIIMKQFEAIPKELKKAEQKITRDMCKPIKESAINNIKRSNEDHEHIKDNIKIMSMKYYDGIATRKVQVDRKNSGIRHDHLVEYGSVHNPIPNPFMGKALLDNKDKAVKIAEQSIGKIIKKAMK